MIYGLLGSNGAANTAFIRLLTAAIKPSLGSLSALGLNPHKNKRALRSKIGGMKHAYLWRAVFHACFDLGPRDNITNDNRIPQLLITRGASQGIFDYTRWQRSVGPTGREFVIRCQRFEIVGEIAWADGARW